MSLPAYQPSSSPSTNGPPVSTNSGINDETSYSYSNEFMSSSVYSDGAGAGVQSESGTWTTNVYLTTNTLGNPILTTSTSNTNTNNSNNNSVPEKGGVRLSIVQIVVIAVSVGLFVVLFTIGAICCRRRRRLRRKLDKETFINETKMYGGGDSGGAGAGAGGGIDNNNGSGGGGRGRGRNGGMGMGLTTGEVLEVVPLPAPGPRPRRGLSASSSRSSGGVGGSIQRDSIWTDDSEFDAFAVDGSTATRTLSTANSIREFDQDEDDPFNHPAYTYQPHSSSSLAYPPRAGTSTSSIPPPPAPPPPSSSSISTSKESTQRYNYDYNHTYASSSGDNSSSHQSPTSYTIQTPRETASYNPSLVSDYSHTQWTPDDRYSLPSTTWQLRRGQSVIRHSDAGRFEEADEEDEPLHLPPSYGDIFPTRATTERR
ncbi:hypothetical protein BCR39DRAFT_555281 [Naematelia encephala]|uniref:Uncharacterized protein n=1 Tax=Naematelia encephala TaxID=71784 RepID=A0A1Y2AE10_9TREE|nr:hypothetical protein BCR39DRAFT_555281 [Naematelia encephala]